MSAPHLAVRSKERTPAAPILVEMHDSKTVWKGRLLQIGHQVAVDPVTADEWIRSGVARAAHVIRVRVLKEIFIGSGTVPAGVEIDVSEDLAGRLHQDSIATVLTPERLRRELPPRRTDPPMIVKLADAVRKVRTVVTGKALILGNRVCGRGDHVDLDEPRARRALADKAVDLATGETLLPLASELCEIPSAS